MNNVGVALNYPEYFAETDVEVREVFPMARIWLIRYRNTSGSLGEQELKWERASVSTQF